MLIINKYIVLHNKVLTADNHSSEQSNVSKYLNILYTFNDNYVLVLSNIFNILLKTYYT